MHFIPMDCVWDSERPMVDVQEKEKSIGRG